MLLTGHTGFKGIWCAQLLNLLGVRVFGLSNNQQTDNLIYKDPKVQAVFADEFIGDVCDFYLISEILNKVKPDFVIHMAAQALVKQSYINPLETFNSNIIGTATILEAAKKQANLHSIICVTSDKCYFNEEQIWGYRETDRLGGRDPYSASKAACELVAKSMFESFYIDGSIDIFTVRAGNVIGGGDMSKDRIMTDIVTSINNNVDICLRYPDATRPWQHVLEPIGAYLHLLEFYFNEDTSKFYSYNIGPSSKKIKSVISLVEEAFTISRAISAICNAPVQLDVAIAYSAPI